MPKRKPTDGTEYQWINVVISAEAPTVARVSTLREGGKRPAVSSVELAHAKYTDDDVRELVCAELGIDLDRRACVHVARN